MAVIIAHASIDEHGQAKNGQAGDQTGKEVCKREWYSKPWVSVIRFTDPNIANKIADCMEMAADNNNIGYDQNQRNTLLNKARKYNYNVGKVQEPCECDCSSLVSVACMYAGLPESLLTLNGNCATTRTLEALLKSTGEVEVYKTALYTNHPDKLKRGDILLKAGSHVAVVVRAEGNPFRLMNNLLKEGSMGESVKWLQWELNQNGANLAVDGIFGKATKLAVIMYQKEHGLVADSIAGNKTLTALKNKAPKVDSKDDTSQYIWKFLLNKIGNQYGVAGLMGNLRAESGLNPKNLQNSCEKKLGMTDDTYTLAVDTGAYGNFVHDSCGYGLAQWTYWTRKQALMEFKGSASIGDLTMQLNFLYQELSTSYKGVLNGLKQASSVRQASDLVLTKYERPAVQTDAVKQHRAGYAQEYYDRYSK